MRENVRYFLAKTAKWAAVVSLLAIIGVIALHLFLRRPVPAEFLVEPAPAVRQPGEDVDRKEGVEHVLFKGDKGKIKVKADKFYLGEDKLNHLEGNVEVVDYGKTGGQEMIMLADRIDYDQNLNSFRATGRARVKDKDVLIESSSFDYDKKENVFRTDQGVVFSSNRLKANSRTLTYRRRAQTLEFEGDLAIEVRAKMETSLPLSVFGDKFLYKRKPKIGQVDGNVRMSHGKSRGTTDTLTFRLTHDEQEVKSLVLQGAAKTAFFKETVKDMADPGQLVEADEIRLVSFPDESKVSRLNAKGACSLTLSVSAGVRDKVQGRLVDLFFDRAGDLTDFLASGEARVDIADRDGGDEKRIWGKWITYHKKEDVLKTVGTDKIPARIDSSRTEVEAGWITVNQESGDMQSSGAVKLVLKPGKDDKAVGFFSKDKPVFITCKDLVYTKANKRFLFKEDVRIWQDKDVVLAKEFEILEDSGEVFGRGGVKASFTHKPKDKPEEERLAIGADEMSYVPKGRVINFAGGSSLNTNAMKLTSANLAIRLKEEGNEMERILAKGKVVILQETKEGRGEEANYDLKTDTVVLTGSPVLVDKEKGITEGDKLTFYLGDGRILIENKERDRSATVIKS
jgi:lipopolysaccharide export system protein LptA